MSVLQGTLCFLQEVLGSHLARVPVRPAPKDAPVYSHLLARAKVDARAAKMALYGFLVSAPISHVLVGRLQSTFAGRTGRAAKIGQVVASNLIVSPIQAFCEFRTRGGGVVSLINATLVPFFFSSLSCVFVVDWRRQVME